MSFVVLYPQTCYQDVSGLFCGLKEENYKISPVYFAYLQEILLYAFKHK